jgi:ABC-type glutathione transport system ATPase component
MLSIKNLTASIEGKEILHGIDLEVGPGEVHAIMGPNGAGKSTLARVLIGHDAYEITGGSVSFDGQDLLALEPEQRDPATRRGDIRIVFARLAGLDEQDPHGRVGRQPVDDNTAGRARADDDVVGISLSAGHVCSP